MEHSSGEITSWAINIALVNSKKFKIISSIFSDHNAVRLDVNYREKYIKNTHMWRLNNRLLNNQQSTEEKKKKLKYAYKQMKMKARQNLWDSVKAVLRGRFIAILVTSRKKRKIK